VSVTYLSTVDVYSWSTYRKGWKTQLKMVHRQHRIEVLSILQRWLCVNISNPREFLRCGFPDSQTTCPEKNMHERLNVCLDSTTFGTLFFSHNKGRYSARICDIWYGSGHLDPNTRLQIRIRLRILLFLTVTFMMLTKKSFFKDLFLLISCCRYINISLQRKHVTVCRNHGFSALS